MNKGKCFTSIKVNWKLFLKGMRCRNGKCAYERYVHWSTNVKKIIYSRLKPFSKMMIEKRIILWYYNIKEHWLRQYFINAYQTSSTNIKLKLFFLLENTIKNALYLSSIALNCREAQNMIVHRKVMLNKKIVRSPNIQLKINDVIELYKFNTSIINNNYSIDIDKEKSSWLEVEFKIINDWWYAYWIKVISNPMFNKSIHTSCKIDKIIEYYCKLKIKK